MSLQKCAHAVRACAEFERSAAPERMACAPGPRTQDLMSSGLTGTGPHEVSTTSVVDAGVAEGGVQQPDHGDRVAADVHRHVDGHLDDVAGDDAGRVHSGTLGTRIGDSQARTRENQTTGGSRSGDDLLDHYSSL